MRKLDSSEPIAISAQDLDNLALLAGYSGEKPLGVYEKLLTLRDSEGEDVFKRTFRNYVEGIAFLKQHPNGFSEIDIINALRTDSIEATTMIPLGVLLHEINSPTPGTPLQNRVEVFVDALFAVK